jgi:hypothetical protein
MHEISKDLRERNARLPRGRSDVLSERAATLIDEMEKRIAELERELAALRQTRRTR